MIRLLTNVAAGVAFCLALGAQAALAAVGNSPKTQSTITLQTARGTLSYSADMAALRLSHDRTAISIFFKTEVFSSGDAGKDAKLYDLLSVQSAPIMEFDGRLDQAVANIKEGETVTTAANGKLTYAGMARMARVPVTVTRKEGQLVYSASVDMDCTARPDIKAQAEKIGLRGPARLALTTTQQIAVK